MKKTVPVSKEVYSLDTDIELPEECEISLFIPGFSGNCKHYYFLVDLREKKISCWTVDFKKIVETLIDSVHIDQPDVIIPWNHTKLRALLENYFIPHHAEFAEGVLYISFYVGNVMLALHASDDSWDLIYDNNAFDRFYSSSNMVMDDHIYFSRWKIEDALKRENNFDFLVDLEIGRYNLKNQSFNILDNIKGPDFIHSVFLAPDGENLILINMNQSPVKRFPRNLETASLQEKTALLKKGLRDSYIVTYNLNKKTHHIIKVDKSPAHIKFDLEKRSTYYTVGNNISFNENNIMCHGNAVLYKFELIDGQSRLISIYDQNDFFRGTTHDIFRYDGKQLLACTAYPNQVFLFDVEEMTVFKKILLSRSQSTIDFSDGPFTFPKSVYDKTPFSLNCIDGSPHIFISNVWNTVLYDVSSDKKLGTINYNIDKPLINIAHTNICDV